VVAWSHRRLREGVATGWGLLQAGSMADTTFAQLRIRLGAHYLYCHQGHCQHILVFMDARLLSATPGLDSLERAQYPRQVFQAREKRRRCDACEVMLAAYAVIGDRHAAASPAYLCAGCYDLLHHDASGAPLYTDYQVAPYFHD
jgi:hypothetical protein